MVFLAKSDWGTKTAYKSLVIQYYQLILASICLFDDNLVNITLNMKNCTVNHTSVLYCLNNIFVFAKKLQNNHTCGVPGKK